MGGTSTDVSLYARARSRAASRPRSTASGCRRRWWTSTTIAAGGGSVLRFADGRLQVGPASAGADPGPACYRRGGPATITDCNVVLGRIPPAHFPHVFGPAGDEPHRSRRGPCASRGTRGGRTRPRPDSTTRWRRWPLPSCRWPARAWRTPSASSPCSTARIRRASACSASAARRASMRAQSPSCSAPSEVLLHPLAGVLSAYGIGLTSRRGGAPAHGRTRARRAGACGRRAGAGSAASGRRVTNCAARPCAAAASTCRPRAHLRLAGSDTTHRTAVAAGRAAARCVFRGTPAAVRFCGRRRRRSSSLRS